MSFHVGFCSCGAWVLNVSCFSAVTRFCSTRRARNPAPATRVIQMGLKTARVLSSRPTLPLSQIPKTQRFVESGTSLLTLHTSIFTNSPRFKTTYDCETSSFRRVSTARARAGKASAVSRWRWRQTTVAARPATVPQTAPPRIHLAHATSPQSQTPHHHLLLSTLSTIIPIDQAPRIRLHHH